MGAKESLAAAESAFSPPEHDPPHLVTDFIGLADGILESAPGVVPEGQASVCRLDYLFSSTPGIIEAYLREHRPHWVTLPFGADLAKSIAVVRSLDPAHSRIVTVLGNRLISCKIVPTLSFGADAISKQYEFNEYAPRMYKHPLAVVLPWETTAALAILEEAERQRLVAPKYTGVSPEYYLELVDGSVIN